MIDQVLDSMDLERERGITIKAQAVRVLYPADDGVTYTLDLIDTPGHVDFTYEVSRSLAACEGVLLLVDAAQGVEAQTVANALLAMNADLDHHPGDQQDRPAGRRPRARSPRDRGGARHPRRGRRAHERQDGRGRARRARGDREARSRRRVGDPDAPLAALIFDSYFDPYRGVVALIRVIDGAISQAATGSGSWPRASPPRSRRSACAGRSSCRWTRSASGEVGLPDHRPEGPGPGQGGRHRHARPARRDRAAARLSRRQADGVHGPLPDRRRPVPRPARRAREADAQRPGARLRARVQPRPRLRLPLRLPRPAAHGDHQGAPRARVRPGPARHGALASSTACTKTNGEVVPVHSPQDMPDIGVDRADRGAVPEGDRSRAAGVRRRGHGPRDGAARRLRGHAVPLGHHRGDALRDAAVRADHGLLRPAQEPDARLRVAGLRVHRLPARASS